MVQKNDTKLLQFLIATPDIISMSIIVCKMIYKYEPLENFLSPYQRSKDSSMPFMQ